jgi:hypothetical protein
MKFIITFIVVALITLTVGVSSAHAWGQNGHRITAEIGERNLNEKSKIVLRSIIGTESLAELATWPDDIRSDSNWDFSQPWHFLSVDDDEEWQGLEREPAEIGDVARTLEILEAFLRDPDATSLKLVGVINKKYSKEKIKQQKTIGKREALAFYVHFIGDIHQPLHVGRRDDRGGNKIEVVWFGENTNAHKVWDELLIGSLELSFTEFATILNRVSEDEKDEYRGSSYIDWAKESKLLRPQVYNFGEQKDPYYLNTTPAPVLSWDYRSKNLPAIKARLTKGGVRVAEKLNELFEAY